MLAAPDHPLEEGLCPVRAVRSAHAAAGRPPAHAMAFTLETVVQKTLVCTCYVCVIEEELNCASNTRSVQTEYTAVAVSLGTLRAFEPRLACPVNTTV